MANRFNGRWSCFIIAFDDRKDGYEHELRSIGTMELEFKANGELERGHLIYDGEEVHLTGTASTGFGERTINLETEFHDTFEGILTFESDDLQRSAVTGKLHLSEDSRLKMRLVEAQIASNTQDDPPWVITKP